MKVFSHCLERNVVISKVKRQRNDALTLFSYVWLGLCPRPSFYSSVGYSIVHFLLWVHHNLFPVDEFGSTLSFFILIQFQELGLKKENLMKKIFLFTALMLLPMVVNAQITITTTPEKNEKEEVIAPYDSLRNMSKKNIMSLEGQTLFIFGNRSEKDYGFRDLFYYSIHKKDILNFSIVDDIYKMAGLGVTPYEAVAGEYYLIKKVIKSTERYIPEYNLLLENTTTKDTLYMYMKEHQLSSDGEDEVSWIIVGFYEKWKQLNVGRCFKMKYDNRIFDVYNSEEKYKSKTGLDFVCEDLVVAPGEYNNLYIVFSNPTEGKICIPMSSWWWSAEVPSGFVPIELYQEYVLQYGKEYADLIIQSIVRIGMPAEVARCAWGYPKDINTTKGTFGVHEQWNYGNGAYLYFENGKLTTIQQ